MTPSHSTFLRVERLEARDQPAVVGPAPMDAPPDDTSSGVESASPLVAGSNGPSDATVTPAEASRGDTPLVASQTQEQVPFTPSGQLINALLPTNGQPVVATATAETLLGDLTAETPRTIETVVPTLFVGPGRRSLAQMWAENPVLGQSPQSPVADGSGSGRLAPRSVVPLEGDEQGQQASAGDDERPEAAVEVEEVEAVAVVAYADEEAIAVADDVFDHWDEAAVTFGSEGEASYDALPALAVVAGGGAAWSSRGARREVAV